MDNYEYCAQWATRRGGKVLDYGCGAGQIVGLMRARGVDASGCDVFYEGGSYEKDVPESLRPHIVRMERGKIPFPDATFDCVLSNQVLEHVPDLDGVLAEIQRVLKPNGTTMHLFPSREVWREGHCGIPFLHRFPKGSGARVYYAAALRSLGLGHFTKGKTVMQWSRDFCRWLDDWTHYRPLAELNASFSRYFAKTAHVEHDWLIARLPRARALPAFLRRFIARKAAGIVIVSQR